MANGYEFHPGHWNLENSGAVGLIKEVVEARRVTKRVHELVKSLGIHTEYIEDNVNKNQKDNVNWLVAKHNQDVDDTVVSIHFNASGSSDHKGIGVEVLFMNIELRDLAAGLSSAIAKASGLKSRGAKYRDNIGVLTRTLEPAILIEVCFVNDRTDVALYQKHFEDICQAIATTLALHKGVKVPVSITPDIPKEETDMKLTATGRASCRQIIQHAVATGVFSETAHKGKIEGYSDMELVSYAMTYVAKTLPKK